MSENECCGSKTTTEEIVKQQPPNPAKRPCGCFWKSETAQLCFTSQMLFSPKEKYPKEKERRENEGKAKYACALASGLKSKVSKVCKDYTAGLKSVPGRVFQQENRDLLLTASLELLRILQMLAFLLIMSAYYLLFAYSFVVYYTLRSMQYFVEADKPMKVTIAIVTITSVIICNEILKRVYVVLGMN